MSRFKLLYFVIFMINLHRINAQISDKRLCVDEECKVPISYAKTLLRYSSPDSRILSFAPNVDITIYSKSAGSREDLWGGEINGKRGYVPKHLVRETKILEKPTVLVNTEFSNETANQVPSQVEPDKVQEPYEVVDGTTIYMSPQEGINPTSTESSVQSTALPSEGATPPTQKEEIPPTESNQNSNQDEVSEEPEDDEEDDETEEADDENDLEDSTETEDVVKVGETQETVSQVEGIPKAAETLPVATPQEAAVEDTPKVAETLPVETPQQAAVSSQAEDAPKVSETPPASIESSDTSQEASLQTKTPPAGDTPQVVEQLNSQKNSTDDAPKVTETETSIDDSPKAAETQTSTDDFPKVAETQQAAPDDAPKATETLLAAPDDTPEAVETLPEDASASPLAEDKPNVDETTNEPSLEDVNSEPILTEETSAVNASVDEVPPVGATTLSPEFEVPEPIVDNFEVTPNPLDAVKEEVTEQVPTVLPPLGLFGGSLLGSSGLTEEIVSEEKPGENVATENNEEPQEISPEEIHRAEIETHQSKEEAEPEQVFEPIESFTDSSNEETEDAKTEDDSSQSGETLVDEGPGFLAGLLSFFSASEDTPEEVNTAHASSISEEVPSSEPFCDATSKMDFFNFNTDVLLYLVTTAISVIIFLFGYVLLDKSKQQGPLIAKINKLEKELLVIVKENQILQEKAMGGQSDGVSSEFVDELKKELMEMSNAKTALEEQVQSLEKELENSTEVGMELNRMLSEILSSESGSEVLQANMENLQRQLVEQQSTINSVNETLAVTNTENHELRLELELSNKKVFDLQVELDKLLLNILKMEEEKDAQQSTLEAEINTVRQKYEDVANKLKSTEEEYTAEVKQLKGHLEQVERKLELKTKEHEGLTGTLKQLKMAKNKDETLKSLLEVSSIKAELQVVTTENQRFAEKIQQDEELKASYEKRARAAEEELQQLKAKYDEADKLRAESQTKLEVLSNYFKDREAQWQKEISKHEALWAEKEGEATSTTERIKFMQEQLQNYKAQTESLKQEIMSQEIELKSQISVLEKKAHENWVSARQAERKAEDAKQEAAQLRHRLTLRERAIQEDKNQHRLQTPIEQNGDLPASPLESPASPPLLYSARDHITKSPPLPGLPPFLPPPPGVPFMPPPLHGVPPFIPPPPNMFPGDHRPPPLGRMSSPPLNRYSPSSRGYSPYDRNSSSPSDSEYGTSPPHRRGYSPFNNRGDERRDYKRPPPGRSNGRNLIKGGSSGSGHSNESLEKISRQQSKV